MIPVMIGSKEMFVRGEAQQWTLGKITDAACAASATLSTTTQALSIYTASIV